MSRKRNRNAGPPLSGKLKAPPVEKDRTTRRDWEKHIHNMTRRYRKVEQRNADFSILASAELSGAMGQRRTEATLNLMDEVYARYGSYASAPHNTLGEEWVQLNLLFHTYTFIQSRSYLLTAAAIWILDRVRENDTWEELYALLPRDEAVLDELDFPDVWDPLYDEELICAVQYVLQERNDPEEDAFNGALRCITDEKTALGKHRTDTPSRRAFEALMALVPEEDKQRAAERFETLFWRCADRAFATAEPSRRRILDIQALLEEQRKAYNRSYDDFLAAADEWKKSMIRPQRKLKALPQGIPDLQEFSAGLSPFSATQLRNSEDLPGEQKTYEKVHAVELVAEKLDELTETLAVVGNRHHTLLNRLTNHGYLADCAEFGEDAASNMKRLAIGDPFELCFALLLLVDRGSDLPWAYGVGTGLMEEVAESLPWGIIEYEEFEDDVWFGEAEPEAVKVPANASIPDMNDRRYSPRGEGEFRFPRSVAQLIYEETGCLMPRDMHLYDGRIRELRRFGVTGKDAAVALASMAILSHARRQQRALNFQSGVWDWSEESEESQEAEKDSRQVALLKNEIKRLRGSLHEADRAARDAKKELESVRQKAELEHRELADLREVVFYEAKDEEETPEAEGTSEAFPYAVRKSTVIFGGHPSWEKAIRPLLTGNVKFVEKDLIGFDLGLVRGADIIWVQSNAMSHKMYYRIIDTARQYKKSVRYFTNASALKCAEQVLAEDGSI